MTSSEFSHCRSCGVPDFELGLISILCPTRERPDNVIRLVDSIYSLKSFRGKVEILFFVDNDDNTFPFELSQKYPDKIKVIRGPRQWISNEHNILYNFAKGEILMTAGDDMVFQTKNWDQKVVDAFESFPDKIVLVYGDDKATHRGKIAVHGFFHQHWVHVLGTWVQPGRGSAWDYWASENARLLGRLKFLSELEIAHIHFRQGERQAIFDNTYKFVYQSNRSFRPEITFKNLERERRNDRILLRNAMNSNPPIERQYWLAETLLKTKIALDRNRALSMRNKEIFLAICSIPFKRVFSYLRHK